MFWQNLESDDLCTTVLGAPSMIRHVPVMMQEVLVGLACAPGKNFLDLTVGGGGHSEAILNATAPDGFVLGCDRDAAAVERATQRLSSFVGRVATIHQSLAEVGDVFSRFPNVRFDGALIDCGVSSFQLEESERGFSFMRPGPIDMRMDQSSGVSAREWLSRASEEQIANTIYEYGDERHSRRIARAIVTVRRKGALKTTADLAEAVRSAVPSGARFGKIHPATKTFQALRIAVNDEMGQLRTGLSKLIELLPESARISVITFHSLEDRLVKELFRTAESEGKVRRVYKKPQAPSEIEVTSNPRARSAKLRVVEIAGGNA